MSELIVNKSVEIAASPSRVWEILVKPEYIKRWDEIPEGFDEQQLSMDSELVWRHGDNDSDFTKLTVTGIEPEKRLEERWFSSTVSSSQAHEINYTFTLSEQDGKTILSISIGDWGLLANGQDYYDASAEFAETAAQKIKELAEK